MLSDWLKLNAEESDLKKRLKEAEAALDAKAYAKYPKLTESEIKSLVVDDKWLAALDAAIHGEMDRVSQQLTQRVKELAERYETPLPQMVEPRDGAGIQGELPPEEDGVLVEVRPGYKQTEVGSIPEDWATSEALGQSLRQSSLGLSRLASSSTDRPCRVLRSRTFADGSRLGCHVMGDDSDSQGLDVTEFKPRLDHRNGSGAFRQQGCCRSGTVVCLQDGDVGKSPCSAGNGDEPAPQATFVEPVC